MEMDGMIWALSRSRVFLLPTGLVALALAASIAAAEAPPLVPSPAKEPTGSLESPMLEELVDEALSNNPEMRALAAEVDAARGEVTTATTWQNPEFSIEPKLTHTRGQGGRSSNEFDGAYGVAQTIEFPGKRALRRALAEKNVETRELAWKGFRNELAIQVRGAFYRLLAAPQLVSFEERRLTLAKIFVAAARKKVDAGFAPEFEATKAEVEVVGAQKAVREAQARHLGARAALNTLLGRKPTESLTVTGVLTADVALPDEATLLAEAQGRNPSLKAQAAEVEHTRLGVQLARRSRLPDFTIGPSYETEPDTQFYALSLSLPLPLWNPKKGEIATAEAEERRASAELDKLRQEVLRDVLTSSQELAAAKEGLSYYTPKLLAKLSGALDTAAGAYAEGRTTLLVFLETQRTYFNTQADYFDTLQKLYEARATLEAAMGISLVELRTPPDKAGTE
jgi:cobalt-zinc-cadmium efflux system outer membrane protein